MSSDTGRSAARPLGQCIAGLPGLYQLCPFCAACLVFDGCRRGVACTGLRLKGLTTPEKPGVVWPLSPTQCRPPPRKSFLLLPLRSLLPRFLLLPLQLRQARHAPQAVANPKAGGGWASGCIIHVWYTGGSPRMGYWRTHALLCPTGLRRNCGSARPPSHN